MKCFAVIAAAALAVASVSAVDCDLPKLVGVVKGPEGLACTEKSGFEFATAKNPDAATVAKVCPIAECQTVLKQVTALGLGDCTVPLGPKALLETDLIKVFEKGCKGGAATTGGSGSGNPSNTVPSPAPVATSKAPAATSKTGSSSGTGGAVVSKTPAPTPAPTSAASSVAVASGAAVLAVAASFL